MKTTPGGQNLKEIASAVFQAAVRAVAPETCIRRHLSRSKNRLKAGNTEYSLDQIDQLYVVGAGKASAAMARAVEAILEDRIKNGVILTKYGHGVPLKHCKVIEAGHPVPDENGVRGTHALLDLVSGAGPEDLILCLISGGGSALSPAPAEGISLVDKQKTTRLLLECGATIHEINPLRKHLSRIKGGRLCTAANGARIVSLILSDVVGDDLDIIASGITAPDPSSFSDCFDILSRYDLTGKIPDPVRDHLTTGRDGQVAETPKPGDSVFERVQNRIVGSLSNALAAAEAEARRQGYSPLVLSSMIQGEAKEVAKVLCGIAREVQRSGKPASVPVCLLSGGETTVTVRGDGLGGRNMELALSAGISLAGTSGMLLLSAGTDGNDGPTDAAGAFADGTTISRAAASGLSASEYLTRNDSYHFFGQLEDLFITGPTRTNVMDLQVLLVDG
ncbi:MAG: glycerate kinase type-2 family protein [Thermodesulfobacteriota bacterium]